MMIWTIVCINLYLIVGLCLGILCDVFYYKKEEFKFKDVFDFEIFIVTLLWPFLLLVAGIIIVVDKTKIGKLGEIVLWRKGSKND